MTRNKAASHLFIDTNVLLGFYAYSNDDLQELEKLINLIQSNRVKLYLTQQVVDEFYRNRDSKLSDAFGMFKPFGNESCPNFMVSLPEYKPYKVALDAYKDVRKNLTEKARSQAIARELLADKLFARLVTQAEIIATDDDAYAAADRRSRLGNPPGKSPATLGDELNWELLLAHVPSSVDLHIITSDGDYVSKLSPGKPKVFLLDEWKQIKSGQLFLHAQISAFFKANYPGEDFSLDFEKQESINALIESNSFASTHAAIPLLEPYIDFLTQEEAEEVVQGALSNSQVAWIASDSDVEAFLIKMLQKHGNTISTTLKKRLEEAVGTDTENQSVGTSYTSIATLDDDDLPF